VLRAVVGEDGERQAAVWARLGQQVEELAVGELELVEELLGVVQADVGEGADQVGLG
jgi:hypothetical protein